MTASRARSKRSSSGLKRAPALGRRSARPPRMTPTATGGDDEDGVRASATGAADRAFAGMPPAIGSGRNWREASMGIRVRATTSDTTSENATVRAWSRKSWAATPSTKTMGTKTQMVVRVEAVIAWPDLRGADPRGLDLVEALVALALHRLRGRRWRCPPAGRRRG